MNKLRLPALLIAGSLITAMPTTAVAQDVKLEDAAKADAAERLKAVVAGMRQSAADIGGRKITRQTVDRQKDVVKSLDLLIEMAESMQQSGSRQQQPSPPNQPGAKPDAGNKQGEPQQGSQQTQKRQDNQQPQESADATSGGKPSVEAPGERRRSMVREVWGHLPAAMQRRLMSSSGEKALPKYERLVEKYFEAIAEPSAGSKREPLPKK